MPATPPGGCSPDWDAGSWDGQQWHGWGCKDWFGKKVIIVAKFRRAGREPAIWMGRSIGMSKVKHIFKGSESRKVDKLVQEKRNETLI